LKYLLISILCLLLDKNNHSKKEAKSTTTSKTISSKDPQQPIETTVEKNMSKNEVVAEKNVANASAKEQASSSNQTIKTDNSKSSTAPSSATNATATSTVRTSSSSASSNVQKQTDLGLASRDEMVNNLLAMGFKEVDCLAAVALYGSDIDRAVSWLCDRPSLESNSSKNKNALLGNEAKKNVVNPKTPTSSKNVNANKSKTVTNDVNIQQQNAAKLQKEKEELRRINKAWNARAEEEKKKV
jgi:hypothetical protein